MNAAALIAWRIHTVRCTESPPIHEANCCAQVAIGPYTDGVFCHGRSTIDVTGS